SERILEDRADLAAAHPAHRFGRKVVDAPSRETYLSAGDTSRRIDQADDRGPRHGFSGAGFADDTENFARRNGKRDVVDRDQRAAPRGKLDPQTLDREQRLRGLRNDHCSFGLSASRSQSPSRLIASTMITSAAPGKIVIHHSPEKRKSLPMRISVPSDGRVGGTPMPRNDSVASVMIAVAILRVASTRTGPSTLGSR